MIGKTPVVEGNPVGHCAALARYSAPARLSWFVVGLIVPAVLAKRAAQFLVPPAPSPWHHLMFIKNLLLIAAIFTVYVYLVRLLEHRTAREVSIRNGSAALFTGVLIGSVLIGLFTLTLWGIGMAHVSWGIALTGLPNELLIPLVTALGEELLFRVILFRIVEEMTGTGVAVLVSAAIFGFSHWDNPGATPFAIVILSLEAGVLLALAYTVTRTIWLAVGIHMSWNFAESFIFGLSDSGLQDPNSLLYTTLFGPDFITGGKFGPEGSILSLGYGLVVSGAFMVLIRRKGNWQPLRLGRSKQARNN